MQYKRIQDLPEATTVGTQDYVLLSQGGVTKRVAVGELAITAGSVTSLGSLTDADTSGAAAGDLLNFDGTKWVPTHTTTNQIYDGGNF